MIADTLRALPAGAERRAAEIAELPYVRETLRLPDFHRKDGMEAPASFVVACHGVIVSQLVSESINDGMGVVRTGVPAADVSSEQLRAVLHHLNRSGATTKVSPGPYSWTPELVEAACRFGAAPLAEHYGLDGVVDQVEDRGRAEGDPVSAELYRSVVPRALRHSKVARSETGLNFGGNHFLEVQAVDRVVDTAAAARLGVSEGELLVMYHLGPGPLGSILSNLYAYRRKPPLRRKVGYAALRGVHHATQGSEQLRAFAALRTWNPIEARSDAGRTLAAVLAVVKNYGFAYRMATVKAVMDAVADGLGQDRAAMGLVVDLSHNILQPEVLQGEELWVSRANSCRPRPGRPGIVAGSNQIASCLVVGSPRCDEVLSGFDHGIGHLLERAGAEGRLTPDPRDLGVERLKMVRGTDTVVATDTLPLLTTDLMDRTLDTLSSSGFVEPVAHLRPVANLKHKVLEHGVADRVLDRLPGRS